MMRKDRIPGIDAAAAYLTKFNPNFRDPKEIERTILECADFLLNTSADAISTIGFYLKLENYYDHNGDFEIWVSPEMWASTAEAIRDIEAELDEARRLLREAQAERDRLRRVVEASTQNLREWATFYQMVRDAICELSPRCPPIRDRDVGPPDRIADAEEIIEAIQAAIVLSRIPAPEEEKE